MTDLDRATLERVLPPAAGSPDWADVMSRTGTLQGRRRRRVAMLAAASLAALVATGLAFPAARDLIGLFGLPPEGAKPSAPESGTLEARFGHVGHSLLYADGRLISLRDIRVPGQGGVDPRSTGWLEQGLTSEGVELIRSEILSVGGFKDDRQPPGSETRDVPEVRVGDRLVRLAWVRYPERLRLSEPEAWLPARAWKDREFRAYVPSRFAVCLPDEFVSRTLSSLPEAAQSLLHNREFQRPEFLDLPESCAEVTTTEARALSEVLDAAGLERSQPDPVLVYELALPREREKVRIVFEPYLPHGEFTCSVCG